MMHRLLRAAVLLLCVIGCAPALVAADPNANSPNPPNTPAVIRKSLARITTTSQDPNYKVPWTPGTIGGGVGAGFVIDGQRIMTNAHVVSNARFLTVEK